MTRIRRVPTNRTNFQIVLLVMAVSFAAATSQAISAEVNGDDATAQPSLYYIEQGPVQRAIDMDDGSIIDMPTEIIWRPLLGADRVDLTLDEFQNYLKERRASRGFMTEPAEDLSTSQKGLDIVFIFDASVPAGAKTALGHVESYLESIFDDPITVQIFIEFGSLSPGVLAQTGVYTTASPLSWGTTYYDLKDDMDLDDYIHDFLPFPTLPVRYNGGSSTVTNENQCYFAWANYGAIGYFITGTSGETEFGTGISWDYDPGNGVSGYCFQSVAVHEIGHSLGFLSRAEQWWDPASDVFALDIFRFQRTDGTGDYNPDTEDEFSTAPRLVDYNTPNDTHNSNLFYCGGTDVEYRMEDGYPNQASHFRTSVYAIMDPIFGPYETFYPDFLQTPDIDLFDAIGWDYVRAGADVDGDGIWWCLDNCDLVYNPGQENSDTDSLGDSCDNCIYVDNPDQADTNENGIGDACEILYICGDVDASEEVDIDDGVYLINYIFAQGPPPDPLASGDVDCSGEVDIDDVTYLIAYILTGGPPPCDPDDDGTADC